jgi:hypothetical protein
MEGGLTDSKVSTNTKQDTGGAQRLFKRDSNLQRQNLKMNVIID